MSPLHNIPVPARHLDGKSLTSFFFVVREKSITFAPENKSHNDIIKKPLVMKVLAVMLGGAVGALLRYLVSLLCGSYGWLGTALVNYIGCFVLGIVVALVMKWQGFGQTSLYLFLTVGLCGSFTTFSTMVKDASVMGTSGNWLMPALYVGLSVAIGLVMYRFGERIVELVY